ncbi:MAG: hypothetical protein PVS2B3_02150 [Steroidobacteraceae bacterium]
MARTLMIGLALLAAARGATADATPRLAPAPAASAASAPADAGGANTSSATADPIAAVGAKLPPGGDVKMSGMSILGNEDAPKSLVLVPWKSSQLADMPSVSRLLDSAAQPLDKDVFMRELSYYEFKSGSK